MADMKQKTYSLTKEEMAKIQNIQSVIGILALQREGLNNTMSLELMRARQRLGIHDADAPEGYKRQVEFDYDKFQLIVTDVPIKEETTTPASEAPATAKEEVKEEATEKATS